MTARAQSDGGGSTIGDYPVRRRVPVRWSDVDMYGHVNNAVYYQWFDSAINLWLMDSAGVDPTRAEVVGVVGESACSFESELRLGDEVDVGLAVSAIGSRSITYVLAAFEVASGRRAAIGHWVHVYVRAGGGGAAEVPEHILAAAREASADVRQMELRKL